MLNKVTRRQILKTAGAGAALALASPFIARAADPIKIGILQPFSGGLELLGQQGAQGTELALLEANEAGGVLGGRQFEIIRADDRTDPKTAVERVNELMGRDRVSAIVGPVTSANRDAILPLIARGRTPLLYATDYEGGACNPYLACYSALPAHWIDPLVPYAMESLGSSYYLVGSDYIWPRKMNEAFRASVTEAGGEVLEEEYTPWGAKDYAATLRKIESSGAEVVVVSITGADAVTFVKQFTAAGLKDKARIIFFGFSENYFSGLTTEESNGIVAPSNFVESLDKPEAKALVEKVRARYGQNAVVSNTVDAHYTMTRFLIEGIERAGDIDPTKVMEAIVDHPILSGNGEVSLRAADRHADLNVLIVEAQEGRMNVLQDLGRVEAPSQCG